ncbi:MbnP family protein [Winogradskyella sp. SM1960]|uniref:MbnP family protein n=1 Tax=Winogradskyella sp. SM1960 TaxID=2865955 RepID=UPI001CD54636|nr:MbnP family protein [Winogradskyella sp. SM1960]
MKNLKNYILSAAVLVAFMSCSKDDDNPVANNVTLEFNNTFGDTPIVLGDATSSTATKNTSEAGQIHHFEEVKYVISNIRLIKADGTEIPYNVNDLDNGATVVNQSNSETLSYVMNDIPVGDYTEIKFGLGVKSELNTLDQTSFPNFYANAGENDTEMHWEWGTGYRFTKIEGFYGSSNDDLSIHSGSTVEGEEGSYTQGVDAYRDIALTLPTTAVVGNSAPTIAIKADFDYLLSGQSHTITLGDNNATPSIHTAVEMTKFVDNLGGASTIDSTGMFSIISVNN